jgi:hypothetical protein
VWPGSRWRRASVAILTAALVASMTLLLVHRGARPAASPTSSAYGQIPSWLPKAKLAVNRVVTASAAHPWLAIEGDTVAARLAGGRTLVAAVGPVVPRDGSFPVPATTPCAFTVTFRSASGAVPLRSDAFTILDELGHLHHPRVTTTGGGAPPRSVLPGQTVSLTVSGVLPTGNGRLSWTPAGAKPLVSWDFDVEID